MARDVTPPISREGRAVAGDRRGRTRRRWILAAALILLVADLYRAPEHQASSAVLLGAIHLYQATASPWMPALGMHCRFTPSCSRYAEGAIRQDGALVGAARAVWRVLRCGPWTPRGTVDPP